SLKKGGSGLFLGDSVITNLHVVEEQGIGAESCVVSLPVDSETATASTQDIHTFESNLDAAAITIRNPTSFMKSISDTKRQVCVDTPPVGAKVVVLGYPSIGSPTDITATDGIVSGYDGDYYITDAKIEHGNSGGVALWVEKGCNLGIPTSATVGTIESLGRILDFRVLFSRLAK
ncbi:MAG: trypsin-like peptidase domain-containing protein, partial [Candidatus Staskawiczbacteria bacterium]|nr:trypsin-like peptidase domain-containing protein [Candidatus Staskawiczbacteria bacterium]